MKFTMLCRCWTAAVMLAALAASAEAGPGVSLFAGTYAWNASEGLWAVTISDKGQIRGTLVPGFIYTKGSISGQVSTDGSYSFSMSVTSRDFDFPDERPSPGGPKFHTAHYKFIGNMASDADGNIVATSNIVGPFSWLRQ